MTPAAWHRIVERGEDTGKHGNVSSQIQFKRGDLQSFGIANVHLSSPSELSQLSCKSAATFGHQCVHWGTHAPRPNVYGGP